MRVVSVDFCWINPTVLSLQPGIPRGGKYTGESSTYTIQEEQFCSVVESSDESSSYNKCTTDHSRKNLYREPAWRTIWSMLNLPSADFLRLHTGEYFPFDFHFQRHSPPSRYLPPCPDGNTISDVPSYFLPLPLTKMLTKNAVDQCCPI